MSEEEQYEQTLYKKMRFAVIGTKGRAFFPLELLMEWEAVRMKINPNAKPIDLMKYERVNAGGGCKEL